MQRQMQSLVQVYCQYMKSQIWIQTYYQYLQSPCSISQADDVLTLNELIV